MSGKQTYVGYTCPADAQAKRDIAAVVSAGMKRNPSYAGQPDSDDNRPGDEGRKGRY